MSPMKSKPFWGLLGRLLKRTLGEICWPSSYAPTLSLREYLKQSGYEAVEKLRVRSALNSGLWLCLIVTVPGIAAAPAFKNGAPTWYILLICSPVACTCIGFIFLLIFDRDKLQSEEYQIRKQAFELIQEKGQDFPVDPASINLIANPEYPKITKGGGKE
jgi:hypothetical protein